MDDAPAPRKHRLLLALAVVLLLGAVAAQWWHTSRHARFGAEMAALAQPGDIHLMAARDCEACATARAWLRQHEVRFTECSIDQDPRCAEEFRALGSDPASPDGKRWPPTLRVRGEVQQGFHPQRIFERLRQRA
jgi:Glutaredoxin